MSVPRKRDQIYSEGFSFDNDLKKKRLDEMVAEVEKGASLREASQIVFERYQKEGVTRPAATTMMSWGFGYGPYVTLMKQRKSEKKK